MALNWDRSRRRSQAHQTRRAEIDDARYLHEIAAPHYGSGGPKRGTLRCSCGNRVQIEIKPGLKLRCTRCSRLWVTH